MVREKVAAVLHDAGFPPDSHSGKDLLGILETYPRDELFQIEIPDLAAIATGIQRLQERRRTRLFLRPDIYGRFMSAVVYLPRDRYTTNVRLRIEQELRETFNAVSIDYEARMTESALARLFFRIRLPKDADVSNVNSDELEKRLVRAARSWGEGISEVLRARGDGGGAGVRENGAKELAAVWAEAFPAGYRVDYEIEDALQDIDRFEKYGAAAERAGEGVKEQPGVHVYLPDGAGATLEEDARVKLYMLEPKSLSQILPYFHNLGLEVLDERPFEIETADHRDFFLYDLGLKYPAGVDPQATGQLLGESFGAAVTGAVESDSFDRLVLREGMHWRQVVVLRAYAKYMRQMGNTNSFGFLADTLLANADVTRGLSALFAARFDPALSDADRVLREVEVLAGLDAAIEQVATLDADRLLRTFKNLIQATLRTNYYQNKPHLSFKLDPSLHRGPAVPAAHVRDLGLLAPGRGRAPPLRQGGPRRPALVGPARGLPHRNPGPGEGADRQERRHRPDRRQGRLLRQAAPGPRGRPQRLDGRGRRELQDVHPRTPGHHGQPDRDGRGRNRQAAGRRRAP